MAKHKHQQEILPAVDEFKQSCNIARLSKNLRTLLLDYIAQNKDWLPIDFDVQLNDYNNLFDLLAVLECN